MSFRAQASLEYFLIFMISLMVAAGVIFVLFNITSGADNILPSSCVFDMGINCYGLMVASNSLGTTFALLGSNTQQYPMSNIGLSITLGAATIANMQCSPGVVAPGQSFLCIESTGQPVPQAYSLKGGLTASVSYCGLSGGDCDSGTMAESYVGTYTSPITQSSLQNFDVVLSPPMYNPPRTPSGSYLVNATLEIFGRNFTISSTKIVPGSDAVITNELNGSTLVETINSICGMKDVSVSYMGMNASEIVGPEPPISNALSIAVSQSGISQNLTLDKAASIAVSGSSDKLGYVLNETQTVNLASEVTGSGLKTLLKSPSAKDATSLGAIEVPGCGVFVGEVR